MKKNIAMRVAAFLFILTMISTCAFATTFAKYTTEGTATDSARVAKFGVSVSGNGEELFAQQYNEKGAVTVKSTEDVLAPGTNGSLAGFTITGTPEVSVEVTYSAELTLGGWTTNSTDEYCPIIITVDGEDYYIGKDVSTSSITTISALVKIENVAGLKTAVQEAVKACSAEYVVGDSIKDTLEVSWSWAFEGNDNGKDTILGNAASATISLKVVCTVTQID